MTIIKSEKDKQFDLRLVLSSSMRGCREANSQSQMGYTVRLRGSSKIRVKIGRMVWYQYHPETHVNGTYL